MKRPGSCLDMVSKSSNER